MIFEKVRLNNFGIYKGEHVVDLNVTDYKKPIILFGGLNGGGKTTFLDSLQLALYGKYAKCSNRGRLSYSDYLKQAINRYSTDGCASVALYFRHSQQTITNHYEVIRSWQDNVGKEITDTVQVFVNGNLDLLLTENWNDFVSEFIPLSMSELFFFDGEKIENLADPIRAASLLKTGIESLLGLELLTQLSKDLNTQRRNKQERNLDKAASLKVDELNNRKTQLENNLEFLKNEIENTLVSRDELSNEIKSLEIKMQSSGAYLLDTVQDIQLERKGILLQIESIDHNLTRLAAGAIPLILAKELMQKTKKNAIEEQKKRGFIQAQTYISDQNNKLLEKLRSVTDKDTTALVQSLLDTIKTDSLATINENSFIDVDPSLFQFAENSIIREQIDSKELLNQKHELQEKLALFDKKLDAVPDYDSVKDLVNKKNELEYSLDQNKYRLDSLMEDLGQCKSQINENEAKLDATLIQQNAENFENQRNIQVAAHLIEMKEIIDSFKDKLIEENLAKLENLIKSKFDTLIRKSELVRKIKINPITFDMALLSYDSKPIDSNRLSAGERQLLSVAILWALAEASGKQIPTIIDTPMGRLDGKHRTKLIENYFSEAAEQVILLSTDEEITGNYYKKLKPAIEKEYHIEFQEQQKTSTINIGYFGERT